MDNIGYLMADNSRLLRRSFDERVRQVGVTGPQARLLLTLEKFPGENQGFHADRLEVEPITLCRMVDRLQDSGLVERRRDPADRRAWLLFLTARSYAIASELRACVDGMVEEMVAGLSSREQAEFTRILRHIGANLGQRSEAEVIDNG